MATKNTLVLLFHPWLKSSMVNAALADGIRDVEGVTIRDEAALYPDGKIDVLAEQKALEAADRIVLQFPMFWYSVPPLLKAWEDAVLTHGWAYGSEGKALVGKELLVVVSHGAPAANYRHDGSVGYTITDVLRPLQATSNLIGTTYLKPFITPRPASAESPELKEAVEAYAREVTADREALGMYE